jgi:centromeric protein E
LRLGEEQRALAAFVSKFDSLGLGMSLPPSKLNPPMPIPGGATAAFAERQLNRTHIVSSTLSVIDDCSPMRMKVGAQPSLLEQMPEDEFMEDVSFEMEIGGGKISVEKGLTGNPLKDVSGKENLPA